MEESLLSPAQRRTLPARLALASKFRTPEEKSEHFRSLAQLSHRRRLTLSDSEVEQLAQLARVLGRIVDREPSAAREELADAVA